MRQCHGLFLQINGSLDTPYQKLGFFLSRIKTCASLSLICRVLARARAQQPTIVKNIMFTRPLIVLFQVITASEFHPRECNLFVYSSSKGTIRLCDMRQAALCDSHAKSKFRAALLNWLNCARRVDACIFKLIFPVFEEPEDPTNRSFFSEIISSISDVKFSNSGRYMISRDYLSVKVWDLHMETKPIETYTVSQSVIWVTLTLDVVFWHLLLFRLLQVHEYLRSKLCSLYENDCIFDKFECCWNGNDTAIMTGSYNNFFRMFDRNSRKEVTYEASREIAKPKTLLKPRKVRVL